MSTWTRLGFTREGSIPRFYKRSDAWILGAVVSQVGPLRGDVRHAAVDDDDDDDGARPGLARGHARRAHARARAAASARPKARRCPP